jgi:hypothetical protein
MICLSLVLDPKVMAFGGTLPALSRERRRIPGAGWLQYGSISKVGGVGGGDGGI